MTFLKGKERWLEWFSCDCSLHSTSLSNCVRSSDGVRWQLLPSLACSAQQRPFAQCFATAEWVQRSLSFGKPVLQRITSLGVNEMFRIPMTPYPSSFFLIYYWATWHWNPVHAVAAARHQIRPGRERRGCGLPEHSQHPLVSLSPARPICDSHSHPRAPGGDENGGFGMHWRTKTFQPSSSPEKKRSVRPRPPCDPTSPAFPSSYLHSLVKANVRFCCLCRAVPQAPKAEVLEGASPFPSGTASPRTSSSLSFCAIELIASSYKWRTAFTWCLRSIP